MQQDSCQIWNALHESQYDLNGASYSLAELCSSRTPKMSSKLATTREKQQYSDSAMPEQSWTHRNSCSLVLTPPL